jgi:hypothetical protein
MARCNVSAIKGEHIGYGNAGRVPLSGGGLLEVLSP